MRCLMLLALALAALTAISPVVGAPDADRVTSLPLFRGAFPSRHYSGYLTALNGSYLHYYLVEAIDVEPSKAPLVWWMNGGPGCSSMDGWGYELGPFTFKNYNATGPAFELNKYTWAKRANLVFVEAPPGVGFSWRESGNYTISDSQNAANNYAALIYLLNEKFPEYKNNKFYIAGESYAGIYVPTLAWQVLQNGGVPGFAGIMVGNGVTSATYDNFAYGDARFAVGHGFITEDFYEQTQKDCLPNENSLECQALQGLFYGDLLQYVNIYGSYFNCFQQPTSDWKYIPALRRRLQVMAQKQGVSVQALLKHFSQTVPPSPPSGDAGVPCIDFMTLKSYLNRLDVKEALHVHESLHFDLCYDIDYIEDIPEVMFVYKALLAKNYSVLVYNGNTDMAVPYTGTKAWMATMNWTTTRPFAAWNYNDTAYPWGPQAAGWSTQYENKLWFVLVNGAGHMVPQTRRAAALDMFIRFTSGRGF